MKHLVLIALGGAGGALARHWMTALVQNTAAGQFPWGTLSVNLLGSLGIGVAYVLIMERALLHPDWRGAVMVGFLGAFTTFSAFSLETLALLENGRGGLALAYMLASVTTCLLAVWLAVGLTRLL